MSSELKEQIRRHLADIEQVRLENTDLGRAAVVLAVEEGGHGENLLSILLTRRTSKLRKHPGQYALPGGKLDAGETVQQAALRELHEELGISVDPHQILGVLDDYPTRSGFCITPVVVWLEDGATVKPNPDEVAKVFRVPIADLGREEFINIDDDSLAEEPFLSVYVKQVGHEVYPPTAAVMYQFYQMAILGKATRVAHFEQPRFTWR